jgi:hypothetical protein
MQVDPMEDEKRRIVYGELIHLPDDLLACRRLSDELLLRKELIELRQRAPLVPAKGINGVIKVKAGQQGG